MSAISRAAFDVLVNSILTSQIAPDSVTPTTLDDLFYAISESYYNKVDGITVDGMTNLISGVANGQQLNGILSLIMAAINNQTGTDGMIPYNFRAEKVADQIIPGFTTGSHFPIAFEDDSNAPNFDTSNIFYTDKFVANVAIVKSFAVEKVCLKHVSPDADTWRIRICKNGVEIASTPFANSSSRDYYYNSFTDTDGYMFPALVATGVSLAIGDVVTAELYCELHASGGSTVSLLFGNPAGKPSFTNA
jgi:hypothetical protein